MSTLPLNLSFLFVGSEWFSHHGGISTFNREMCKALANLGHQVYCLVPEATSKATADAEASNVVLLEARSGPGLSWRERLCLPPPDKIIEKKIDVVVGHAHVTGPLVQSMVRHFFSPPKVSRRPLIVHFIHTDPGEIEWYKDNHDIAERIREKQALEKLLAYSSDLVVAVGPQLRSTWATELHPDVDPANVLQINPGLSIHSAGASIALPEQWCLVFGRTEDFALKGIDIAAMAVKEYLSVVKTQKKVRLVVLGAQDVSGLRNKLISEYKLEPGQVKIKKYTTDIEEIQKDILRSAVVLMPSRAEGFGLSALEAIALRVPTLISSRSGLAEMLTAHSAVTGFNVDRCVVQTNAEDIAVDVASWSGMLAKILDNWDAAREDITKLCNELAKAMTWTTAAQTLVGRLLPMVRDHQKFTENSPSGPPPAAGETNQVDLDSLIDDVPTVSIVASASRLERVLSKIWDSQSHSQTERGRGLNLLDKIKNLLHFSVIDNQIAEEIKSLWYMRNQAVHGVKEFEISEAKKFISRADGVIEALDAVPSNSDGGLSSDSAGLRLLQKSKQVRSQKKLSVAISMFKNGRFGCAWDMLSPLADDFEIETTILKKIRYLCWISGLEILLVERSPERRDEIWKNIKKLTLVEEEIEKIRPTEMKDLEMISLAYHHALAVQFYCLKFSNKEATPLLGEFAVSHAYLATDLSENGDSAGLLAQEILNHLAANEWIDKKHSDGSIHFPEPIPLRTSQIPVFDAIMWSCPNCYEQKNIPCSATPHELSEMVCPRGHRLKDIVPSFEYSRVENWLRLGSITQAIEKLESARSIILEHQLVLSQGFSLDGVIFPAPIEISLLCPECEERHLIPHDDLHPESAKYKTFTCPYCRHVLNLKHAEWEPLVMADPGGPLSVEIIGPDFQKIKKTFEVTTPKVCVEREHSLICIGEYNLLVTQIAFLQSLPLLLRSWRYWGFIGPRVRTTIDLKG